MDTGTAASLATQDVRVTLPLVPSSHVRRRKTEPRAALDSDTGNRSRLIRRAIHHVEARWRESHHASRVRMDIAPLLEAMALTVDCGDASFLNALTPRPPLRLSLHVVDLLQDELLALWPSGEGSAAEILQAVNGLRLARVAIKHRAEQLPGSALVGLDGVECLLEFVHDMRSPLTSVHLLADRLLHGLSGPLTPLQLSQLRLIYGAAHALNTVTSNALQLTRERDQLEEPEARPFSVTRLLSDVQEAVRALAEQKGLEIAFIRPNADRRSGHAIELHRILLNLVTNALKFTRFGRIVVSATDREDGQLEFAVQDSGPGIPACAQETLFQPFRRSRDGGHTVFSATGLGLVISQRLVEALNGRLTYQTAPGAGTRFSFVLGLPIVP